VTERRVGAVAPPGLRGNHVCTQRLRAGLMNGAPAGLSDALDVFGRSVSADRSATPNFVVLWQSGKELSYD